MMSATLTIPWAILGADGALGVGGLVRVSIMVHCPEMWCMPDPTLPVAEMIDGTSAFA
jgi:hypothetical protein